MKPASKQKRKVRSAAKKVPARRRARKQSAARAHNIHARAAEPKTLRRGSPTQAPLARAIAHSFDDRQTLALLMVPFLLMATGIGISHSIRTFPVHGGSTVAIHHACA